MANGSGKKKILLLPLITMASTYFFFFYKEYKHMRLGQPEILFFNSIHTATVLLFWDKPLFAVRE